jgi:hypothetical protein
MTAGNGGIAALPSASAGSFVAARAVEKSIRTPAVRVDRRRIMNPNIMHTPALASTWSRANGLLP